MSFRCIDAVFKGSHQRGPALLVLLALADYANDEGKCWPSMPTLAEKCRMKTARSVIDALAPLRTSGEVVVHKNAGKHGQNVYQVAVARLERQAAERAQAAAKKSSLVKDSSLVNESALVQVTAKGSEEIFAQPAKDSSPKPSVNHQEEPSVDGASAASACAATALTPSAPSTAPVSAAVNDEGNGAPTPRLVYIAPPPYDGQNEGAIPARATVSLSKSFDLPADWGHDAVAIGWKASAVLREAEKFKQFWTVGKGAGTRRSLKGWRQTWSNWLTKAEKINPNAASGGTRA